MPPPARWRLAVAVALVLIVALPPGAAPRTKRPDARQAGAGTGRRRGETFAEAAAASRGEAPRGDEAREAVRELRKTQSLIDAASAAGVLGQGKEAELTRHLNHEVSHLENEVLGGMSTEVLDEMMRRAASDGNLAAVRGSLRRGANVDSTEANGRTALMHAAAKGHVEIVSYLLAKGADVNARAHCGAHPLIYATRSGKEALVRALLDAGASVDLPNNTGETALMIAARRGHRKAGEVLVSRGANVEMTNSDGWTALHSAASEGQELMAMLLLSSRGMALTQDHAGRTAEAIALEAGHASLAAKLGAQANQETANRAELTHLLSGEVGQKLQGDLREQMRKGAKGANAGDVGLALRDAAKRGRTDVLGKLLASSPTAVVLDAATPGTGATAVWLAAQGSQVVALEMLVQAGADIDLPSADGRTALMLAATRCPAALDLLLKAGADWRATDKDGRTAHFKAAMMGKNKANPERASAAAENLASLEAWAATSTEEMHMDDAELQMKRQTRELQDKKLEMREQEMEVMLQIQVEENAAQRLRAKETSSSGGDSSKVQQQPQQEQPEQEQPLLTLDARRGLDLQPKQQKQQKGSAHGVGGSEQAARSQRGSDGSGDFWDAVTADVGSTVQTLRRITSGWLADADIAEAQADAVMIALLLFPVLAIVLRGAAQAASMKASLEKLQAAEEDRGTCPICLERYDEKDQDKIPRIATRCGHTFCGGCIGTMLTTLLGDAANPGHKALTCPTCRAVTEVPKGQASRLPTNFALLG